MSMRIMVGVATVALLAGAMQAAVISNGALDATTLGNWRTAAPDADNMYGTDGYVMFYYNQAVTTTYSHHPTPGYNPATMDLAVLPSYISGYSVTGYQGADGGTDGASYPGVLQDPTTLVPTARSGVYGWYNSTGPDVVVEFTMAANQVFVLMLQSHYVTTLDWDDSYVISGSLGGSGVANGVPVDEGQWWAFTVNASAGEVITVRANSVTANQGALLAAVAFDPVPEPATISLIVAGFGMLLRKKRK